MLACRDLQGYLRPNPDGFFCFVAAQGGAQLAVPSSCEPNPAVHGGQNASDLAHTHRACLGVDGRAVWTSVAAGNSH